MSEARQGSIASGTSFTEARPLSPSVRRLTAVVLIALVPRTVAALALGNSFHFADEAGYADAARRLLSGEGFGDSYRGVPGYPALLALLGAPAPSAVVWLRLAQAVVAALGAAAVSRSAIAQTSSKLIQWVRRMARPTQR
jgi:hypothetical protein